MGIIGWISMAFELIRLFRAILAMIAELKKNKPDFNAKDAIQQATDALAVAKKTGNTTKLDDIYGKLKTRCEGVGCAADTLRN